MPLREYRCLDCGYVFEILVSIHDAMRPTDKCPKCEGRNLRKQITKASVIFKGDGWTEK